MMRTQFVLTMELVSSDVVSGAQPLPPKGDPFWEGLVRQLHMSREQISESMASYQMAMRCKVRRVGAGARAGALWARGARVAACMGHVDVRHAGRSGPRPHAPLHAAPAPRSPPHRSTPLVLMLSQEAVVAEQAEVQRALESSIHTAGAAPDRPDFQA